MCMPLQSWRCVLLLLYGFGLGLGKHGATYCNILLQAVYKADRDTTRPLQTEVSSYFSWGQHGCRSKIGWILHKYRGCLHETGRIQFIIDPIEIYFIVYISL